MGLQMPNVNAAAKGVSGEVAKSSQAQELPIPEWARRSFAPGPVPVINPVDQWAAGRLLAFGGKRSRGEVIWPWMRGRMSRGGLEVVQGLQMLGSDAGYGRRM